MEIIVLLDLAKSKFIHELLHQLFDLMTSNFYFQSNLLSTDNQPIKREDDHYKQSQETDP